MAAFSKFFDAIVEKFREGDAEWKEEKGDVIRKLLGQIDVNLTHALCGPTLREVTKADTKVKLPDQLWEAIEAVQASEQQPGISHPCMKKLER
jgi:hypothetical protein